MGEETSLARQLKKLAAPQTSILFLDKRKPSLLFDSRDAASLDRDTFYAYGCTGLDKLILIERKFSTFHQTLFNESSKTLERSVQTKEINQKLDSAIADFLRLLSPYFLLRGAHEALEWLIYRFHIHLFNVDDLIACVLPHHETRIFVRVVQLLDLQNASGRWHWLKPIQDSGAPIETSTILNHFISDGGFRKFVCDLVPNIMKVYEADRESASLNIISFSTLTVYHSLMICSQITDNIVAVLLPYIVRGLKSEVPSYCSGSYMIMCAVLMRVKLSQSVLETLLIKIVECQVPSLLKQSLEMSLLVFQQQDISSLPKKAFTALCSSSSSSILHLKFVSDTYRCTKFIHCLLKRAVPVAYKKELIRKSVKRGEYLSFLLDALDSLTLQKADVAFCLRLILNWYVKLNKINRTNVKNVAVLKKVGKSLLKCIEMRWAESFDFAVESYFEKKSSKKKKAARTLLNEAVTTVKHGLLPDSSMTVFLGINHPVASIRTYAVSIFLKELSANHASDIKFVEDTFINRLNDDSPDVLHSLLSSEQILLEYLTNEQLLTSLNSLLEKSSEHKSEKWLFVKLEAVKLLCQLWQFSSKDESLKSSIFSVLLPFLLPLRTESMECLAIILNSSLGKKHLIIRAIKRTCLHSVMKAKKDGYKFVEVVCKVIKSLLTALETLDDKETNEIVTLLVNQPLSINHACSYHFILAFILQYIIRLESSIQQQIKWTHYILRLVSHYLDSNKDPFPIEAEFPVDINDNVKAAFKSLKRTKHPLFALLFSLQEIIKHLKINCFSKDLLWWLDSKIECEANFSHGILFELFEFLTKYRNRPGQEVSVVQILTTLFGTMIQAHFKDVKNIFWFLSSVWTSYRKPSISVQVSALKVAETFCLPPNVSMNWINEKSCVVLPSLFVMVASDNVQLRTMALELLKKLLVCENRPHHLQSLVKEISSQSEEIAMDSKQLFQIVGHWLSAVVEKRSSRNTSSSNQSLVLEWLQQLVLDEITPKVVKLNSLSMLQFYDSKEVLTDFLPILKQYLIYYKEQKEVDMLDVSIIQCLLNKFSVSVASLLENETSEAFIVLTMALQLLVQSETSVDVSVHEMALNQITKEFFIAIPCAVVQQRILGMLIDLYHSSVSSDMTSKIGKTLKKLCMYASQLLKELHALDGSTLKKTVRDIRRSKTQTISASSDFLDNGSWKKITVILETIQNKKKIYEKEILVPELFNILSKTLEWANQPPVEYLRQLVLSSIFNCCDQLGISGLDETKFQVELVVQCIRVSDNPKTHHLSLLLLNLAATMFPDYVLNNIMSIFTFMGSSIVRQDDSYSFQVISQTIETIVPALLRASHQQKENECLQVIATVIRVFVDSLLHIPGHRQLPLFTKLITTLGPSDYLWLPLTQICESYIGKESSASSVKKGLMDIEKNPMLEFVFNLYQLFSPTIQVNACTDVIQHLFILPDCKDGQDSSNQSEEEKVSHKEPFDVSAHTDQQLQLYKFAVLSMLNALLSSQNFIGQVSGLEEKFQHQMEEQYKSLFEKTLEYLRHMSQPDCLTSNGDLWKTTTFLLYDLLNNINALLPCDQFISVILSLLQNKTTLVRRKTLEMLNAKLEHQPSFFTPDKYGLILKLLRPLLKIIKVKISPEVSSPGEKVPDDVQNRQNALLSVHLISQIIGGVYPEKFQKVLFTIVGILSEETSEYPLVVNALLCLAQLCKCLKAHVLPQLSVFMPKIVDLLGESEAFENNAYLALGVVTALQGLVEFLGVFLSAYIKPIVTHVCELASKYATDDSKTHNVHIKLRKLLELIAKEIPVRVLIPAIRDSYEGVKQKNQMAVSSLMFILQERISAINLSDLQAHCSEMEEFYIMAMNFRTENPQLPLPTIEDVEGSIIASVMSLVMKLSEPAFHSLFRSIYHWAIKSSEHKDKMLTFYRLTHELSMQLKSLFVVFVGVFVRHASSLLDSNNIAKTEEQYFGIDSSSVLKSSQLLGHILDTFTNCFLHDNKQVVDKDCFNTLMQPLVDQIENEQGTEVDYRDRIENQLTPCIANFAASVNDNSLWKPLNYQILLKTRHSSSKVRFASLQVIRDVVKKMDTEYLTLLPEAVPFLAELMEDESFEVEQLCQTVVAEMELILGESISKYF